MGGIAEDALLYGAMTRDHYDVDMCLLRADVPIRIEQSGRLGFDQVLVKHNVGGVPMVYEGHHGDLHVELGPMDVSESGELSFVAPGSDGPIRVFLPDDTFKHAATAIDGTPIQTVSPRMLFGLRAGLQAAGGFGPLDEGDAATQRLIREKLLGDGTEEELQPRIERLYETRSGQLSAGGS
jgi:hypothetical protein